MSAAEANPVTDPETQSIMEDLIAKMGADESFTEYANDQHTQLQMYIEKCRAHLNILAEDRQLYRQMYLEKHRAHLAQERVERWWEKFIGIVTIAGMVYITYKLCNYFLSTAVSLLDFAS
ncbi:hypothetical protein ACHAPF_002289 [Botrytis cinerea]